MIPARALMPLVETVGREEIVAYVQLRVEIDENGCWNWLNATNEHGYANLRFTGFENVKGHRLMWVAHHGQEAASHLAACHRCDNRRCVNPDHIFLDTPRGNASDRKAKGRYGKFRAEAALSRATNDAPYLARKRSGIAA